MGLEDIKRMGDVTLEPGEYGRITAAGDLKLKGDTRATSIKSMGDLKAKGLVQVGDLKVMGDSIFENDLKVGQANIYGEIKVLGDFTGDAIKIYGEMNCQKAQAEEISIYGEIHGAKELSCENFKAYGEFHVATTINMGHGECYLSDNSSATEILCESLKVNHYDEKEGNILKFGMKRSKRGILTVHTIEGDHIKLEDTHAEVVRGRTIEIGRGCKIGKAIYQVSLDIYEDGIVDQVEEF